MTTPGSFNQLMALGRLYGVQRAYYDSFRRRRQAEPAAMLAVLRALGAHVETAGDVPATIKERTQEMWRAPLEPAAAAWQGRPFSLKLKLPAAHRAALKGQLSLENGEELNYHWNPQDLPVISQEKIDGTVYRVRTLPFPDPLPLGYHRLKLDLNGQQVQSHIISAPMRAYDVPSSQRQPDWGVFLPLHALRSKQNWTSGDYNRLGELMDWVEERGGKITQTLPLLPIFAGDPSPYMPVSRLVWNEFYVDISAAPEMEKCSAARQIMASAEFLKKTQALKDGPSVDYPAEMKIKQALFESLAECLFQQGGQRREELARFLEANPGISEYARFRAAGDKNQAAWQDWPAAQRGGQLTAADYDEKIYRGYLYAQWLAHEQLGGVAKRARGKDQTLYIDLPVGVHPAGFDAWRFRNLFVPGLSTGAPPDPAFTTGQGWGFSPLHPERIREEGYGYVSAYLRHNLSACNMLRIDHVMGMHRLFVIPQGMSPAHGVYLRYPQEELYAVLTLESHKSKSIIVGEDLGTVPPQVRPAMTRHGLRRMFVLHFELEASTGTLNTPHPNSVASINTHDMTPFAGYWSAQDIDEWQRIGIINELQARELRAARAGSKELLLKFLHQQGIADINDAASGLRGCLAQLASTGARTVMVSLEDLWGEIQPQNIPGTNNRQYPNWQRKARFNMEGFKEIPELLKTLKMVDDIRKKKNSPKMEMKVLPEPSLLTDEDLYLFNEGSHFRLYDKLGAHALESPQQGVYFAVWAPNAQAVSVMGDFNGWDKAKHFLLPRGTSGIWEGFIPGIAKGALYKYHINSRANDYHVDKADPYAFMAETPPRTASVIWDSNYTWTDHAWMAGRKEKIAFDAPVSIYELHLASWRRVPEEGDRPLTYREIAPYLADYIKKMGFTHVEMLPVMEHPFGGSWGYQITSYFAPSARFGTPQDFMYLIDYLHQRNIGVILDWVPSHFPGDEHSLGYFDGTHLYEHADPRLGFHPDWNSLIFNYGRNEVRSFLISNAMFWLDKYHIDGLRLDAVASMLYRDYSRKAGEWLPNKYGGRENLDAISFLKRFNEEVYRLHPDVHTFAEESTSWPMVSRPVHSGGLGFGYKWDMGWMHDTLEYMAKDPVIRRYHHNKLSFRQMYACFENFVLPLSHDEAVHGKGSLLGKMPGDDWQKFANLRLMLGYMYGQTGKKLLFMGDEFGQRQEWNHDRSLDWHLLGYEQHQGIQRWVQALNALYSQQPALHEKDTDPDGFEWIEVDNTAESVFSFVRKGYSEMVLAVYNFTPVPRLNYRVGVPRAGRWSKLLNGDDLEFGGSGVGNPEFVESQRAGWNNRADSLVLNLPPLAAIFFKAP